MKYVWSEMVPGWDVGLMAVLLQVEPRLAEFYVYLYTFYVLTVEDPVVGGTLRVIHYTVRNNPLYLP